MEINTKLSNNPMRKVALLITKASDLGMDLSIYGSADENPNSGNVYLWLEDYPFTLFINLGSDEIYASWFDHYTGNEVETAIGNMSLTELEAWAMELENESERA